MLSKKILVGGLAFMLLAVLALVMVGGRGEGRAVDVDFRINVSHLGEACQYWAPSPPKDGRMGPIRQHSGQETEVVVSDTNTVAVQHACTDQPPCDQGAWTPDFDCFLGGEHYIQMGVNNPTDGCVSFAVDGLRGAAANISVDGSRRWGPVPYLSTESGGVNTICDLQAGQQLKIRLMMCPDVDGNHKVNSIFWDILPTLRAIGTVEGDADWDYRLDHNEDGAITFFGDGFAVMYRYGLDCDDFDY